MSEDDVRRIIQEEFIQFLSPEKYTFQKHIQMFDGRNVQTGRTTGTIIATKGYGDESATDVGQKLGFFGVTPVVQPRSTGEATGFTAGAGTSVLDDSTFTGNTGSIAYTIGDIVKHLKNLGLIDS